MSEKFADSFNKLHDCLKEAAKRLARVRWIVFSFSAIFLYLSYTYEAQPEIFTWSFLGNLSVVKHDVVLVAPLILASLNLTMIFSRFYSNRLHASLVSQLSNANWVLQDIPGIESYLKGVTIEDTLEALAGTEEVPLLRKIITSLLWVYRIGVWGVPLAVLVILMTRAYEFATTLPWKVLLWSSLIPAVLGISFLLRNLILGMNRVKEWLDRLAPKSKARAWPALISSVASMATMLISTFSLLHVQSPDLHWDLERIDLVIPNRMTLGLENRGNGKAENVIGYLRSCDSSSVWSISCTGMLKKDATYHWESDSVLQISVRQLPPKTSIGFDIEADSSCLRDAEVEFHIVEDDVFLEPFWHPKF